MNWKKLSHVEINNRIKEALSENINFREKPILGIPASFLDEEEFYSDAELVCLCDAAGGDHKGTRPDEHARAVHLRSQGREDHLRAVYVPAERVKAPHLETQCRQVAFRDRASGNQSAIREALCAHHESLCLVAKSCEKLTVFVGGVSGTVAARLTTFRPASLALRPSAVAWLRAYHCFTGSSVRFPNPVISPHVSTLFPQAR